MKPSDTFRCLSGETYGRLTIIHDVRRINPRRRLVLVSCQCGSKKVIGVGDIVSGATISCGCLNQENRKEIVHGGTGSTEYRSWAGMKNRCLNPLGQDYHLYGGRGITVSAEWKADYRTFLKDMGRKPTKRHSLDRIDNFGPYCKENCRWATPKQQRDNSRSVRFITIGAVSLPLRDWARISNVSESSIRIRLARGWNPSDAIKKLTAVESRIFGRRWLAVVAVPAATTLEAAR